MIGTLILKHLLMIEEKELRENRLIADCKCPSLRPGLSRPARAINIGGYNEGRLAAI
jgi:hypothetical protein